MTPGELTGIGSLLITAIAVVVLPVWFKRQSANQAKIQEAAAEAKERARMEAEKIRKDAERDAHEKTEESVTWEKLNRALNTSLREERAAFEERLTRVRQGFDADTARIRTQTDYALDRAQKEIRELSEQVQASTRQITELTQQITELTTATLE